jgi:hypothetical protein
LNLLRLASTGYEDGWLDMYFKKKTGEPKRHVTRGGDTLARFIVIELAETFDEDMSQDEQIEEAQRALQSAIVDLEDVITALGSPAMLAQVLACKKDKKS